MILSAVVNTWPSAATAVFVSISTMSSDKPTDKAEARAEALRRYEILDTEREQEYDDITRLACLICKTPIAAITLMDRGRGWFKSEQGLGVRELAPELTICSEALVRHDGGLFVLEDAAGDPSFCNKPCVVNDPGIRFYAGAVLENPQGVPLGMLCVLDTEPRQLRPEEGEALRMLARKVVAALELRLSRGRFRATAEGMRDGVFTVDRGFRVAYANGRARELLGCEGELADRVLWELFGQGERDALARELQESARRGGERDFQVALPLGGKAALLEARTVPSPDGMTVFVRDITSQRIGEEQLRVLGTCVARLNDIVLITEAESLDEPGPRIVYANPAFLRLTGYRADEVLGHSPRFLQGERTQREALDRIRAALARRESCREEVINYSKDGKEYWLELDIAPVPNSAGKVTHFIAVERDITQRKREEAERTETVGKLRERVKELQALHEVSRLLRSEGLAAEEVLENVAAILRGAMQRPEDTTVSVAFGELRRFVGEDGGGPFSIEACFEVSDGTAGKIRADWTGASQGDESPFLDEEQIVIESVAAMLRSHFDLALSQEAIKRSEHRYRLLFASNPYPMWVFDLESLRFLEVNEAVVKRYGYSRAEFLSMTLEDIGPPEDVPALRKSIAALGEGVQPGGIWRHRMKDGRIARVETSSYVLRIGGRQEGLTLAVDVTDRVAAEKALRLSEGRLALTQKIAQLGSVEIDGDLKRATCSAEAMVILGVSPPAGLLDYERLLELVPVEDRERVRDAHRRALAGEGRLDLDHRVGRPDGAVRWVHELGELQAAPGGSDCYLAVALVDITERKIAERRLRESEERFRLVSRATNDVLWEWDFEKGTVTWNDGYERLLGRKREEVAEGSKSWTKFIHPEDLDRVVEGIHAVIDGGETSWEDKYRMFHADGSVLHLLDRGEVLHDASGKPVRMIGGITDVSEITKVRDRLREQALLLDKANDAILVRGLDHRILSWNKGAERLYGYSATESVGRFITELLYESPEQLERFEEATRLALEGGGWSGEIEQVDKEGRTKIVEGSWTLVRDEAGRPASILAINTDITEKRLLERQFMRTQRMESLGTLAGGIAHDLNNVLTPILMSIGLLKDEASSPERRELLEAVEKSAKRGADMVKQVLAFGRGVDGQQCNLPVVELVEEVVKIARETFPKNISVEARLKSELWPVLGDATQLHQVLLNLAVNARDAMPEGGRLIFEASNQLLDEQYVTMIREAVPGPYVVVQVEDSGMGMPPAVIDRIFEPFFTTKEFGKGTGLGLSTSLAIVKSHGGFIRIYSELRKGTRFRVYLPVSESAGVERSVEAFSGEPPRGGGETVLVVDDEAVVRDISKQTLETFGYRVVTACDGAEAVAIYAERRAEIDVVLTDMMMPVMDGPSMIRVLLRMDPKVRIIAASGLNANGMVAKASNAGVQDFIPKPYTAEALLRSIATVLGRE